MPAGMVTGLRGVDLWGTTPPPSERMMAAQKKIQFAASLFRP